MYSLVKSASKVITPLGPIRTFAARDPWMGLEGHSFEEVARRLKDTCDVDIYPDDSVLQTAWNQGEIRWDLLESGLGHWLDRQSLELPREEAERFCLAALMLDNPTPDLVKSPKIMSLAKKLSHSKLRIAENRSVKTYSQRIEQQLGGMAAKELDRQMIKWCKLFLDESQAVWSMPNREEGFFRSWRRLIRHDPALHLATRKLLNELPEEDEEEALREALSALGIPQSTLQNYLEAHLLALPGWAGMMLWRSQQSTRQSSLLTEYLAVRISMEWALIHPYLPLPEQRSEDKVPLAPLLVSCIHWGGLPMSEWTQLSFAELKARLILAYRFDKTLRKRLWLEAWEQTYEEQLKNMITLKQTTPAEDAKPVSAQFVFCIDVRSEPFRRKLEKAGPFETFGTAGFFGMPIEKNELGSKHNHNSLPVMLKPRFKVQESTPPVALSEYLQRQHAAHSISLAFHKLKHSLLASLLLPEISGPWLSLQTLARSFIPRSTGYAIRKIRKAWLRKPAAKLLLNPMNSSQMDLPGSLSEEEKVYYVRQALKMMDLTEHFAPLVVICGHGSHSTNNPYASALDCGACGGTSGGFNARVLAVLCNLPEVRQALAAEGILIPEHTVFAAAEHVTTLDELHWLYVPELSATAKEAFDDVQAVLPSVCEEASAERIRQLPNIGPGRKNLKAEAQRFAEDWSELRPEWGLARNAVFIIGERELTKGCNLEGRAFLQNYNWRRDKNGSLLAGIIAGPTTVAQWINLQYYASTVAPHYYGSGNKATQTVTAGIGVMQGNASDLLIGLPWQSVMQSDQEAYHAPLRLLVVVQAPSKYVEQILDQVPGFRQKVQNGWIRLASIDPEGRWMSWA